MNKCRIAAILFAIRCTTSVPSHAQDIDLNGVMRVASLYTAIVTSCGKFYKIDRGKAETIARSMIAVAKSSGGETVFKELMMIEFPRRSKEVKTTGEKQWYAYQRAYIGSQASMNVFVN